MDTLKHLVSCIAITCALAGCDSRNPRPAERGHLPEVNQRAVERDTRRAQLLSELQEVDQATTRAHLSAVEARRRTQAQAGTLGQLNADMEELHARLKAYMLDHKLAVAAIAAGVAGTAIALDDQGSVSLESKEIAALVGAVAVGWALFNMDEVFQVGQALLKADVMMTDFRSRAQALRAELSVQQQALDTHERELARLGGESSRLRTALAALGGQRALVQANTR